MDNLKIMSEQFSQAPIEHIVLNDGREINAKKISRKAMAAMDVFIPGMKSIVDTTTKNLDVIAKIGKTPLFVANGDYTQYMRKADGAFLGALFGKNKKIEANPGFQMTDQMKEGAKIATSIGKAIPYVQIAITVIEIGVSIVNKRQAIKAEIDKFYNDRLEELSDHNDALWAAMDDYTVMVSDDATRAAYMSKIIDAINAANKKFNEMKAIAAEPKNAEERTLETMKAALLVYSLGYLLKIMYSKTECKSYIQKAVEDIHQRTAEMNMMIQRKFAYDRAVLVKKKNNNKIAEKIAGAGNAVAKVAMGVLPAGVMFAAEKIVHKQGDKLEEKSKHVSERLHELRMASNPYANVISNLNLLTSDKNLILLDKEYVYYEIPESCAVGA